MDVFALPIETCLPCLSVQVHIFKSLYSYISAICIYLCIKNSLILHIIIFIKVVYKCASRSNDSFSV